MYKFSPSSLSLLKECPRCFWLKFRKGIEPPSGIFPSLPSGMDRILKLHFDRFREKKELPPELKKVGVDVKLFSDLEKLKEWQNSRRGLWWEDKKGNILHGGVDYILEKGSKLIVLDFKTRGYALKEDTASHYQHQMDIYNFLLRKMGHSTEDYAYLLFYYPKEVLITGEVIFDTELVKMKTNPEHGSKLFKKALKVLKGKMPKASKECEYCGYCEKR